MSNEQQSRLIEMVKRVVGPEIAARLEDPAVTDILINEDGAVIEDRAGVGKVQFATIKPSDAEALISVVADMAGEVVNAGNPILECEFYNGGRFEGVVPPVTSAPVVAIRLHAPRIYPLSAYVKDGIMTQAQAQVLHQAVVDRLNILVSGATKAGKTTLLNALAQDVAEVWPDDRILIMQQVNELQCPNADKVYLRTSGSVTDRHLLRAVLRMRPDRIVVGEVRGGEALDMLKAWNTGHDGGFATVHANSAKAALRRLEQLVQEVSTSPMQELISEAVNVVVQIVREGTGRRVSEIARVRGYDHNTRQYELEYIGE